jgi:hypothetical protein
VSEGGKNKCTSVYIPRKDLCHSCTSQILQLPCNDTVYHQTLLCGDHCMIDTVYWSIQNIYQLLLPTTTCFKSVKVIVAGIWRDSSSYFICSIYRVNTVNIFTNKASYLAFPRKIDCWLVNRSLLMINGECLFLLIRTF